MREENSTDQFRQELYTAYYWSLFTKTLNAGWEIFELFTIDYEVLLPIVDREHFLLLL